MKSENNLEELGMRFKIGDICDINKSSLKKNHNLDFINYLDTGNITEGRVDEIKKIVLAEEKIPSRAKRIVKENDIIISTVRPNQKHYGIIKNPIENLIVSTGFVVLSPKKEVNADYLYNYLTLPNITEYLQGIAETSTTAYPSITPSVISDLEIELPSLVEQKAIADILSSLDEKIELNNQMNETLEEMAQALFKRWFVDFEFPNEEGQPYKSSGGEMVESELGMIPSIFRISDFANVVTTYNGYSYKGKELGDSNDAMVTIKNFDRKGGYKLEGLKEIILSDRVKPQHFVEVNDIIVAHTDLTQGAEIIGNPIMVLSKGKYEKLIMSMDTVKVKSKNKNISDTVVYLMLKDRRFKEFALAYTNGTTVLHLSKKAIPLYKFAKCENESIYMHFDSIVSPMFKLIAENITMNEELIELRDTLLPKLMSGEIRVSDLC